MARKIVSAEDAMAEAAAAITSDFRAGSIFLRFDRVVPGDPAKGLAPAYHFKVIDQRGACVGHINFRVGESPHVTNTAGHLGFSIFPEHRGLSYAYHACVALAPFVRSHYAQVILTADPENAASINTIQKLGARFIDEVAVPADDPAFANGARRKRRFEWSP